VLDYREFVRQVTPPIVLSAVRRWRQRARPVPAVPPTLGAAPTAPVAAPILVRQPEWEYVPEGWRDADPRAAGWLHDSIVATQRAKWADVVRSFAGPGPLGIAHEAREITPHNYSAHNLTMSFAYVLARAARQAERLAVLDWGGGLGHYALVARAVLPEVAVDYVVHDLPGLCTAGRELLPSVAFSDDEAATFARQYDLVFASSSLQYARDWRLQMAKLASAARHWLFLTRLPTVATAPSFVVVQRPKAYGYDTEYISWMFNRGEMLAHAASCGLRLEREFLVDESPAVAGAPERSDGRGLLFRRP
jgi:putative methyltransferase (TIGR04325 family)